MTVINEDPFTRSLLLAPLHVLNSYIILLYSVNLGQLIICSIKAYKGASPTDSVRGGGSLISLAILVVSWGYVG